MRLRLWAFSLLILTAPVAFGSENHPVIAQLHRGFPSVNVDGDGRAPAPDGSPAVLVSYPSTFGSPRIAALDQQRIALRPLNTRDVARSGSDDRAVYENAYAATDVVEVPSIARSEEILLIHGRGAPLVFDYEISDTTGVAAVSLHAGAVRFVPTLASVPAATSPGFITLPRSLQLEKPIVVDALGHMSDTAAQWTLIGKGAIPPRIRLTISAEHLVFPIAVSATLDAVGVLHAARREHTSTLLPNGKVLIAGGLNGFGYLASAEIYDPDTGLFTPTASMAAKRARHTATLMTNGKVLITGGVNSGGVLPLAEIYDPATGTFKPVGSMATARSAHTATALANDKVLVVGGFTGSGATATAEIYTDSTQAFTPTGSMTDTRYQHTAVLLLTNKVLIAGGTGTITADNTSELYDPATGLFTGSGTMVTGRYGHTATTLANGNVLIAGGVSASYLNSAEIYSTSGGTFAATGSMSSARYQATAALLPSGKVMLIGGQSSASNYAATTELFDTNAFSLGSVMATTRSMHTSTLLMNGRVLIAGGYNATNYLPWVELYDPSSPFVSAGGSLTVARFNAGVTTLLDGRLLLTGGATTSATLGSAEIYDPASNTSSVAPGTMVYPRSGHSATLLLDGRVLITGGFDASVAPASNAEIYDPTTGTFTATSSSPFSASATLLPDGEVLLLGGGQAWLYEPGSGSFTPTGGQSAATAVPSIASFWHAPLMANGRVLLINNGQFFVYDPISQTFSAGTPLVDPARSIWESCVVPLQNGLVLVAGGGTSFNPSTTAELYDPATGTSRATGTLNVGRYEGTATLLTDGHVLITGGGSAGTELYDPATETFSAGPVVSLSGPTPYLLSNQTVLFVHQNPSTSAATQLLNTGLGYPDARRPLFVSAPTSIVEPSQTINLIWSNSARDDASGSTGGSATPFGLVELRRVDSGLVVRPQPDTLAAASFASSPISGVPAGTYGMTVVANGVPSAQKIVTIRYQPPTISGISPSTGTSGTGVTITGTNFTTTTAVRFSDATHGSVPAAFSVLSPTTISVAVPGFFPGPLDVTVYTAGGAASDIGAFTYTLRAPTAFADGSATTEVLFSWIAVPNAALYEVQRSTSGTNFVTITKVSGTAYYDDDVAPNNVYLYRVRVIDTEGNVGPFGQPDFATTFVYAEALPVQIKASHINELRTVATMLWTFAGIGTPSFADPTLTPGVTPVKAQHLNDIRTALLQACNAVGARFVGLTIKVTGNPIYVQDVLSTRNVIR